MRKVSDSKSRRLTPKILKLYNTTDLTSSEIGRVVKLSTPLVKMVAKENGISVERYTKRPKSSMCDEKRNDEIVRLIKEGVKYDEIGRQMGISRQRVYQFAKLNNISRWGESREYKTRFIEDIKTDIRMGLSYDEIYDKYELIKKGYLLSGSEISALFTNMMSARNEEIKREYRTKSAKKVLKVSNHTINNPIEVNNINTVYRVSSNLGFRKYPMIGNRSAGGVFEDRKILQYIQRKKDKDGWSFPKISEKLNRLGHRTLTGKEFTTPNVIAKYHAYKKNKHKRLKGL